MSFLEKLREKLEAFWYFLKPKLKAFHQARKRVWKKYHLHKIFFLVVLTMILISSIYLFYLAKQANVETLKSSLEQVTTLYDKDDDLAGTLYGQKGTYVELNKISPNLQKAVVATEDRRFYTHHGYDIKGIARAFLGLLTKGHITGGGSTLTQQLAKNAYLTQKQTFDRKAKELFLAIEIEKNYSKDEILTMYLNNAYFANGVWGVEDASQKYFGKSAKDVSIGEAAILIGMLKGPGIYNPIDNPENATARRKTVLTLLADQKIISKEQAAAEEKIPVKSLLHDNYANSEKGYKYPWFFDEVIREAKDKYGISESDLLNKGYKIYTTLGQYIQSGMQKTYNTNYLFPENATDGTMVQSGSVAINPATGGVLAVVGGRNDHVFLGFNRATMAKVPPGSTIKPLVSYTPALEAGMKPTDLVEDKKQDYYPDGNNMGGNYRGEMPMYEALAHSTNMPAVWLLHKYGLENGFKKAENFGLKLNDADKYWGLALGGLTTGVSPLTMASAYSVFANDGVRIEPYFIRKIVDATGAVVAQANPKKITVTTKKVADEMTSMLQGVFSSGTAVNAQPDGYQMAGKTGSTETSFGTGTKDQWLVGYTPDVVIASWLGFDNSNKEHYLVNTSGTGLAKVFKNEAENILKYTKGTDFSVEDVSKTEGNKKEETTKKNNWNDFAKKVGEGAKYWGGKVKDGLDNAVESFWNFVDGLKGN